MTTLTQAAFFSKKWTIVAILGVLASSVVFYSASSIKSFLFPPKPAPATIAFGKLPAINWEESFPQTAGISYKIETISGGLPTLAKTAKVFALGKNDISFGTNERIKEKAAKIGFTSPPQELAPGILLFVDEGETKELIIDATTDNIDYENKVAPTKAPPKNAAVEIAHEFLRRFTPLSEEFPASQATTENLIMKNDSFEDAKSLAEANVVKVSFQRGDLDKLKVFSPKSDEASVTTVVSQKEIISTKVKAAKVLRYKFATYPLRSTQDALQDLKNGDGAFNTSLDSIEFVIRKVHLGYYDSSANDFFYPVYVFEGDDDLLAFAQAVQGDWILKD